VKNHNEDPLRVNELIEMVKLKGGIEYTQNKMEEYKQSAMKILDSLPESASRQSMKELVNYITERNY
jgi:octaprenyl-diphosphate synthase